MCPDFSLEEIQQYLGMDTPMFPLTTLWDAFRTAFAFSDVGEDDYILCQSFAPPFVVEFILKMKARPYFVDSEGQNWNMSAINLYMAIDSCLKYKGCMPKAIVLSNLYAFPSCIDDLLNVAHNYHIRVICDAISTVGTYYKNRPTGTYCDFGIYSFGGFENPSYGFSVLAVNHNDDLLPYMKIFIDHYSLSFTGNPSYKGNLNRLLAKIPDLEQVASLYYQGFYGFQGVDFHYPSLENFSPNFWVCAMVIHKALCGFSGREAFEALQTKGYPVRRLETPLHRQSRYSDIPFSRNGLADTLYDNGFILPSSTSVSEEFVHDIVNTVMDLRHRDSR